MSALAAPSFEALDEALRNKIETLQICAKLRDGWDSDTVTEFAQLQRELESVRRDIAYFREVVSTAKTNMAAARTMMEQMNGFSAQLSHMKDNLPAHLPTQRKEEEKPAKEEKKEVVKAKEDKRTDSQDKAPARENKSSVPNIEYITVEEFEAVPKYLRGRLQYEQINAAVEEYNKALEKKYALLRRPRSKLSNVEMKIVTACRQQENQDTRGLYFVVDGDIKRWSGLKLDSNGRSIMTVLRTLRRLREVRGPGCLVRYAVL